MIGLEIIINDQEPIIAASDNLTFIALSHGCSCDEFSVIGSDDLRMLTWFDREPEKGDKVLVRIVETDKVTPVIKMRDRNRNDMKELYEYFKAELQEKGMI